MQNYKEAKKENVAREKADKANKKATKDGTDLESGL